MEYRPLFVAARLIALLAVGASALAADSEPSAEQQADWQRRLDRAAALKAEGKARQEAADKRFAEADAACDRKFLVNACRDKARTEHLPEAREARRLENEGKALEREVKKEQLSDRDQRRAAAAPQHEADLRAREAETAAERRASAADEAATRAHKAQQAAEGSQRKAAEAERQRKKQEDHAARVARKMRDAERRAAEADAKP